MTQTPGLNLPLVQPSQAQKHVTVNAALLRLDAAVNIAVQSRSLSAPPANAPDGAAYVVAAPASGEWLGQEGRIAFASGGLWEFLVPGLGWSVRDLGTDGQAVFDGQAWIDDAVALSGTGAATQAGVTVIDVTVPAGGAFETAAVIPHSSSVLGVSSRVIAALTGTATSWRLGVTGSDNRYGSGFGIALNSYSAGLTGTPVTYYGYPGTTVLISPDGGDFAGGTIRLAVHHQTITPPRSV